MKIATLGQSPKRPKRKDFRLAALAGVVIAVVVFGWWIQQLPDTTAQPVALQQTTEHQTFRRFSADPADEVSETVWKAPEEAIDPLTDPNGHARQAKDQEAQARFHQALIMLQAQRFDEALAALNRVLELRPASPETLTNKGFALLAIGRPSDAFTAFDKALNIDPQHANAYYGAAVALEKLGNLEAALSGMRSFLHTTEMGPEKLYVARARSAIWEWESRLGRGPWGPTRGIPPGFSEAEVLRDGKGVGVKMPIPETADSKGRMRYEIKSADKIEIFER